jgi:hypothetical protein
VCSNVGRAEGAATSEAHRLYRIDAADLQPGDRAPENLEMINRKQLGDLKLTDKQEVLLVAFLKTLTDG